MQISLSKILGDVQAKKKKKKILGDGWRERKYKFTTVKYFCKFKAVKDIPDIERTLPTSSVVKFKPPSFEGLTAHNEKTCRK